MSYHIEKGIDVPVTIQAYTCPYPFKNMEVGDSFLVPKENVTTKPNTSNKLKYHARRINTIHRLNNKYVQRKLEEGIRCWRLE